MPEEFILKYGGAILAIFFLWLVVVTFVFFNIIQLFKNLTKGTKLDNLIEILEKIVKNLKENSEKIEKVSQNLQILQDAEKAHLQKISLLRFNPFGDVGGNQSFVATFLDGENSGIIISSLHSREQTRVYAKPIEKGKPKVGVRLSDEEEKGLKIAVEAKNG